jgi:hypothetical protein
MFWQKEKYCILHTQLKINVILKKAYKNKLYNLCYMYRYTVGAPNVKTSQSGNQWYLE